MKTILVPGVLMAVLGLAMAKLPAPDDATKAKAAETSAKAAWQAKVDAFQLCKAQDKVAAAYVKTSGKTMGKEAVAKDAKAQVPATPAPTAPAAQPAAAAASGTPVITAAAPVIPPCAEPGPFAYNPPEQKPLETAGAHSPTGTAASPPSVKPDSAQMAPAKK